MVCVDFSGVEWRSRADEEVLATFVGCGVEVTCMAYMFRVPGTLGSGWGAFLARDTFLRSRRKSRAVDGWLWRGLSGCHGLVGKFGLVTWVERKWKNMVGGGNSRESRTIRPEEERKS